MFGSKKLEGLGKVKIDKALGGLVTLRNDLNDGKKLNNVEISTKQKQADEILSSIKGLEQSNADATECCENIEAIIPKGLKSDN